MQNRLKMYGSPVVSLVAMCVIGVAGAAESGRAAYNVSRLNRGGMSAAQRMPTMPTLPINTTGNMTIDLPATPPSTPDVPDKPDDPTPPDDPKPECPDGGVKNSEYTVDNCMRDVFACVNNGALPNGINDLFNEDLRNSIINGMGLCTVQVERCIAEVRRDCENIYHSSADVWLDFNARKVQPEYYSFVLRKTGLTPRQAENTCWLLDKNTYGTSFDAVANSGVTTYEYNNRVGAYNGQGGANIIKKNPQGATLNNGNNGVDGGRGHYARWDATTAECHIRVAAYNKDTPIKNSWLFGAVGDDRLAEAWQLAGSTFTCNKDLFGFSLYKNTNTVAVVGIGGGTLVGAGIGALAGHGKRDFDCTNSDHRERLMKAIKANNRIGPINLLLSKNGALVSSANNMTEAQCNEILGLYDKYKTLDSKCKEQNFARQDVIASATVSCTIEENGNRTTYTLINNGEQGDNLKGLAGWDWESCLEALQENNDVSNNAIGLNPGEICAGTQNAAQCAERLVAKLQSFGKAPVDPAASTDPECVNINEFDAAFAGLDSALKGDANNRVKTTLTGAAIGAGAGGLATAITAFVEKNNINCRLGDGLDKVGYGKSMSVGTLRDFYVKWNLHLPENVVPTGTAVDCASWRRACAELTDLEQCKAAQINYMPANAPAITLVHAACIPSGSVCIENYPVAKSYGACLPQAVSDDNKGTTTVTDSAQAQ